MAGWICPDGANIRWDGNIHANSFIGDGSSLTGVSSIPAGTIVMYGGSTAPAGWLLCNGQNYSATTYADLYAVIGNTFGGIPGVAFNVPDMRGIFPRGAGGSNGHLSNANGTAFSGTLGTYQNDSFQGHWHKYKGYPNSTGGAGWINGTAGLNNTYSNQIIDPMTNGTNGTPRTGTETNPANLGLNFIIKT